MIFGSESDQRKAEEMIANNKNISMKSFCGKYDLRKSLALIAVCNFAFAADSGLGHISSVLGIPTVSFLGQEELMLQSLLGSIMLLLIRVLGANHVKKIFVVLMQSKSLM